MSQSNSPAFNPPMNRVIDSDPQIERIPLDHVAWGNRKSAQPQIGNTMTVKNLPSGGK